MITVDERKARLKSKPSLNDAIFLAQYGSDTGDYLDAVAFYRRAEEISNKTRDYSYDIFKATANAIWKDMAVFKQIFPAADAVLNAKRKNDGDIIGLARIMGRLARKKEQTNSIGFYLKAGVEAAQRSRNPNDAENLAVLRADYALYVDHDTSGALEIRKTSLGQGWKKKPEKFYNFAKWCAERKINLGEAEFYARESVRLAADNEFKAKVLFTLAEICHAQGKLDEAISLVDQAIDLDPKQDSFFETLVQYRLESGK